MTGLETMPRSTTSWPQASKDGDNAFAHHDAARARVASDDHLAGLIEKGSECGAEVERVCSAQSRTDDAANANRGDPQRILVRHG